jgi:hypothetical protein
MLTPLWLWETVFFHPDGSFDFVDSGNVKQLVELTATSSA